jgi:hypothetical protein
MSLTGFGNFSHICCNKRECNSSQNQRFLRIAPGRLFQQPPFYQLSKTIVFNAPALSPKSIALPACIEWPRTNERPFFFIARIALVNAGNAAPP